MTLYRLIPESLPVNERKSSRVCQGQGLWLEVNVVPTGQHLPESVLLGNRNNFRVSIGQSPYFPTI